MTNPALVRHPAPEHPVGFANYVTFSKMNETFRPQTWATAMVAAMRNVDYMTYVGVVLCGAMAGELSDPPYVPRARSKASTMALFGRVLCAHPWFMPMLTVQRALAIRPFDVEGAAYLAKAMCRKSKGPKLLKAGLETEAYAVMHCSIQEDVTSKGIRKDNASAFKIIYTEQSPDRRWVGCPIAWAWIAPRRVLVMSSELIEVLCALLIGSLKIRIEVGAAPDRKTTTGASCATGFPGFRKPAILAEHVMIETHPVLDAEFCDWGFISILFRDGQQLLKRFNAPMPSDSVKRTGVVVINLRLHRIFAGSNPQTRLRIPADLMALWRAAVPRVQHVEAKSTVPEDAQSNTSILLRRGPCVRGLLRLSADPAFAVRAVVATDFSPADYPCPDAAADFADALSSGEVHESLGFSTAPDAGSTDPFVCSEIIARRLVASENSAFQRPPSIHPASLPSRAQPAAKRRRLSSIFLGAGRTQRDDR